jgi:HEAT repeat protein
MSKSARGVEAMLAQLNELRSQLSTPETSAALARALSNSSNLVAAKAAALVREGKLQALVPQLVEMFHRFMRDPARTDKGCAAKKEAAQTLYEFGASEGDLFLAGARHVQLEASWGKPVDTAAELRGICALGLVRIGHPKQLEILAEHLMDSEPQVRHVAARACGYSGLDTAALMLRMKILAHDAEEAVTAECFAQLVKIQPRDSLAFVRRFIESPDASLRQAAILALGESRDPEALRILIDQWEGDFRADAREMLVPAIAAHRSRESVDFLLDRLASIGPELGGTILRGLSAYRHDSSVVGRVRTIIDERGDDGALRRAFESAFTT